MQLARSWIGSLVALGFVLSATQASAVTLDFDGFTHGQIISASQGVIITTVNRNNGSDPDYGVAFDTTVSRSADPDLQVNGGWAGGNAKNPSSPLNNILIIQENDTCNDVACTHPDDEGGRPAGTFTLDYTALSPMSTFAFDLVDVESASSERGSVEFRYLGGLIDIFDFGDFLLLDQDVEYGNRTANHVVLEVGLFDEIIITMGGSGGVDNITTVPELGTLALSGAGVVALAFLGRRRPR